MTMLPNVTQVGPTSPTNLMDRLAALEAHNVAQDARIAALEAKVLIMDATCDEHGAWARAARTKALNLPGDRPQ